MSGQAAMYVGLAIASYEWIAAVSLVIVAFVFLPRFLKAGVYTVPHFLETRYNRLCRTLMSLSLLGVYAFVTIGVVNLAGARAFADYLHGQHFLGLDLTKVDADTLIFFFSWVMGIFAAVYVWYGGLKSAAWAGSLQGTALILCGVVILYFAMSELGSVGTPELQEALTAMDVPAEKQTEILPQLEKAGAWERFTTINNPKLRMNLPWDDMVLPITALIFGIWIPNLYYWGLDQHIMQRTLGARSLSQGQKGIVLAAFLKLLIPFIVIFPGMIAFNLYSGSMKENAFAGKGGYEKLEAEREKYGQLFDFDEKFALFEKEAAKMMLQYNAKKTGVAVPETAQEKPFVALGTQKKDIATQKIKMGYGKQISGHDYDSAFGLLVRNLVPEGGFRGFVLAALFGMVVSALAAMLNAVSTLFSIDIYKEFFRRKASEGEIVWVGRISVGVFMVLACFMVPVLHNPKFGGIFTLIQEFQGFVSPGVLCAFMFGFFVPAAPRWSGTLALLGCPVIYGLLKVFKPDTAFLDRMSITFVIIAVVMTLATVLFPLKEKFKLETNTTMDLKTSKAAVFFGLIVVLITAWLYSHFWDYQLPLWNGFIESFSM
jgi:SSS family solute:Na+ symporter